MRNAGRKRRVVFLGVDGVVLLPTGIAPYAKPFLHWATRHFDVRWLSRRPLGDVFRIAEQLNLRTDAVPCAGFTRLTVEAVARDGEFRWIEAPLPADERAWLGRLTPGAHLPTNPSIGVTPNHKAALEQWMDSHG